MGEVVRIFQVFWIFRILRNFESFRAVPAGLGMRGSIPPGRLDGSLGMFAMLQVERT